jgi:hypothetical protein
VRVVTVRQRAKPTRAVTTGLVGLGGGSIVNRHHTRPTVISARNQFNKNKTKKTKKKRKQKTETKKKRYKCMFANIQASSKRKKERCKAHVRDSEGNNQVMKVRATIKS